MTSKNAYNLVLFFIYVFNFMGVLFDCMYKSVYHMHALPMEARRRVLGPLKLEL